MVRGPCCEKMGLKKGPWSAEEDRILINYVQAHGHTNWRALPKQAGLLRCGKSCRLRWTNYLRPDIKRGNFTPQEEHTIFNLHQMLGNRWSAIAARLPGRTDNEIKNVWHTHLKKRLPQNLPNNPKQIHSSKSKKHPVITSCTTHDDHVIKVEITDTHYYSTSPPQSQSSSSDDNTSTLTTSDINNIIYNNNDMSRNINVGRTSEEDNNIEALDDDFWSEVLSADDSAETSTQIPHFHQFATSNSSSVCHAFSMDFWYHVYTRAEGLLNDELPQL